MLRRWNGPAGMGADRAERHEGRLTSSFSSSRPSSSPCDVTPLPIPARPRGRSLSGQYGRAKNVSRTKYRIRGPGRGAAPISWGPGRQGSGLLVRGRRLAVLAPLHVLLVQRHALLAERTGLRRVGREVAAHQAEDLLAPDLRLLRAPPQGPDAHHLAAELLHQLREQPHRGAGADQ